MKKLIIILLSILFALSSQENWQFKQDKVKHSISGIIISSAVFIPVASKTSDINLAFRASWMASGFAALGKEFADGVQGKEISLSDMSYTIGSGLITAYVFRAIAKRRKKKFDKKFNIEF